MVWARFLSHQVMRLITTLKAYPSICVFIWKDFHLKLILSQATEKQATQMYIRIGKMSAVSHNVLVALKTKCFFNNVTA